MHRPVLAAAVLLTAAAYAPAQPPPTVAELIRRLESGPPGRRVIAAELLGQLGPAAADAAPALARVMRNARLPDREAPPFPLPIPGAPQPEPPDASELIPFEAARDALARIGAKAAPALAGVLAHESGVARAQAAEALGWMGEGAAGAVPALTRALADDQPAVRAAPSSGSPPPRRRRPTSPCSPRGQVRARRTPPRRPCSTSGRRAGRPSGRSCSRS
ncbi:HEAT repeat domain-containing protein [bacterium]|nr:HEAT repeat domain-containing protein [bacterium]